MSMNLNCSKCSITTFLATRPSLEREKDTLCSISMLDYNCLLLGASGTGKNKLAKALHSSLCNPDNGGVFKEINCSRSNDILFTELVGYTKGAYTGAATTGGKGVLSYVDKGTVFLDEIANTTVSFQDQLLTLLDQKTYTRVGSSIEEKKTNARFIAATNKIITKEIQEGKFKEDLFLRLKETSFTLPSLNNSTIDIRPLLKTIVPSLECRENREFKKITITENAIKKLESVNYTNGNIRLLRQILISAIVCQKIMHKRTITIDDVHIEKALIAEKAFEKGLENNVFTNEEILNEKDYFIVSRSNLLSKPELEKNYMRFIMQNTKNVSEFSRVYDISRDSFYKKARLYRLEREFKKKRSFSYE